MNRYTATFRITLLHELELASTAVQADNPRHAIDIAKRLIETGQAHKLFDVSLASHSIDGICIFDDESTPLDCWVSQDYRLARGTSFGARPVKMTVESIAADPWNAVRLAIPANADTALLSAALAAAKTCVRGAHAQFEAARAGTLVHPDWRNDRNSPDNHEFYEQDWLDALDRYDEFRDLLNIADTRPL